MKEATKEEEKKDLQTKDALSIDAWVTILSSEINRNQEKLSHFLNIFLICMAILIALVAGFNNLLPDVQLRKFPYVIIVFIIVIVSYGGTQYKTRIETLESIREDAIIGNIDTKEITRRWSEEYIKLTKKILGFFN
jgi:Na+/glutamate symporter